MIRQQPADRTLRATGAQAGSVPAAAQEQGRVFERFYRSPSVKNQVPGFGLGLAIANNIAQAHHGELTVNSRPGETTFRLTLPLPRETKTSDAPGARA